MQIPKQSLFAILSRSPWWVSVLIAAALFMALRTFLPDYAALFSTLPFLAIAGYAGWRELRTPSAAGIADTLARLRAMSWEDFSVLIEEAFRRDGYELAAIGGAADYQMRKGGRVTLVSCKRWKIAQTGIGPLRELYEAKQTQGAHECMYVAAGGFSANAQEYAAKNAIGLLSATDLAQFIGRGAGGKTRRPAL